MNHIVLDLEWNQSSTQTEPEVELLPFEIIEIGAIKLNEKNTMISEFNELVKPKVYHSMHHITSKLIHLQMQELQRGEPFSKVGADFLNWCGSDFCICTWGPSDVTELQRNFRFFNMPFLNNGPVPYLDVQKLFTLAFETDRKMRRNLEYAVDFLGIEKDIPFHRAFSDAYYTAKVYVALAEQYPSLLTYVSYDVTIPPANKDEELHLRFDTYEKYISRAFASRELALADKEVLSSRCFQCGKTLRKKIRWFSTNGRYYLSVAHCDKHGFQKGKIRINKLPGEEISIVKTSRMISEAEMKKVEEKYEKAAQMKHRKKEMK